MEYGINIENSDTHALTLETQSPYILGNCILLLAFSSTMHDMLCVRVNFPLVQDAVLF